MRVWGGRPELVVSEPLRRGGPVAAPRDREPLLEGIAFRVSKPCSIGFRVPEPYTSVSKVQGKVRSVVAPRDRKPLLQGIGFSDH